MVLQCLSDHLRRSWLCNLLQDEVAKLLMLSRYSHQVLVAVAFKVEDDHDVPGNRVPKRSGDGIAGCIPDGAMKFKVGEQRGGNILRLGRALHLGDRNVEQPRVFQAASPVV